MGRVELVCGFYRAACRQACWAAPGSSLGWWLRRTASWELGTAETTWPVGGWRRTSGSENERQNQKRALTLKLPYTPQLNTNSKSSMLLTRNFDSFRWLLENVDLSHVLTVNVFRWKRHIQEVTIPMTELWGSYNLWRGTSIHGGCWLIQSSEWRGIFWNRTYAGDSWTSTAVGC